MVLDGVGWDRIKLHGSRGSSATNLIPVRQHQPSSSLSGEQLRRGLGDPAASTRDHRGLTGHAAETPSDRGCHCPCQGWTSADSTWVDAPGTAGWQMATLEVQEKSVL